MARLDDLAAELNDKLLQRGVSQAVLDAALPEVRQRLQSAWEEGQLAMRSRANIAKQEEVLDSKKVFDPNALTINEDFR